MFLCGRGFGGGGGGRGFGALDSIFNKKKS